MIYHSATKYYPDPLEKSSIFKHLINIFSESLKHLPNNKLTSFKHLLNMGLPWRKVLFSSVGELKTKYIENHEVQIERLIHIWRDV